MPGHQTSVPIHKGMPMECLPVLALCHVLRKMQQMETKPASQPTTVPCTSPAKLGDFPTFLWAQFCTWRSVSVFFPCYFGYFVTRALQSKYSLLLRITPTANAHSTFLSCFHSPSWKVTHSPQHHIQDEAGPPADMTVLLTAPPIPPASWGGQCRWPRQDAHHDP